MAAAPPTTAHTTRRVQPGPSWAGLGPPWLGTVVLALVAAVIQVGVTAGPAAHGQEGERPLDLLGVVLLLAGPAALVVRRRQPVATLVIAFVSTLAYSVTDYPRGPVFVALIIALVTVVLRGYRTLAWVTVGVGFVAFLWLPVLVGDEPAPTLVGILALGAWLLVLVTGTEVVRTHRERAVEAAQIQEEEARRRSTEERMRIARELHDVLAHNISLINVQAGVALHLLDDQPDQARPALTAIKEASKEALGELRSVLDVLRTGEAEPLEPAAGIGDLEALIARTRAAGLDVRLHVEGNPRPLPRRIDLAAYRIIQEALTNVVRHAGARSATVRIAHSDDEITLQVDDDGLGPVSVARAPRSTGEARADGAGRGIAGMRERAAALGGHLEAGPRPGRGYRVRARLPLGSQS